jgi:hypothetical protein
MRAISWLSERLLASKERLCPVELKTFVRGLNLFTVKAKEIMRRCIGGSLWPWNHRTNCTLLSVLAFRLAGGGGDLSRERASTAVEVVVERLVQRLLCGASTLDSRFSSKFLATLDGIRDRSKVRGFPYKYTIRGSDSFSPQAEIVSKIMEHSRSSWKYVLFLKELHRF